MFLIKNWVLYQNITQLIEKIVKNKPLQKKSISNQMVVFKKTKGFS